MKESFLSLVKTKKNANEFFEFADLVVEKTYGVDKFSKSVIEHNFNSALEKVGCEVKPSWFDETLKQTLAKTSLESIRELFKELILLVSGAELVKVEASFEPSTDFVNEVYETVVNSGLENFLLDIEQNPKLHSGAKFFVAGKYVNLTLSAIISKYLRTKDVINKYL